MKKRGMKKGRKGVVQSRGRVWGRTQKYLKRLKGWRGKLGDWTSSPKPQEEERDLEDSTFKQRFNRAGPNES